MIGGLFHVSCVLKAINTKYDLHPPTRTRAGGAEDKLSPSVAGWSQQPSPAQPSVYNYITIIWAVTRVVLHQLIWRHLSVVAPNITMGRIIHCSDLILRIEDHQVANIASLQSFYKVTHITHL